MDNILLQLGVGGIFAVLIIREFVSLISKIKNDRYIKGSNGNGVLRDIKGISIDTNERVKDLHVLHSKTDNEGRPVWYFPYSIVEHQKRMASAQSETMNVIRDVVKLQNDMCEKIRSIDEKILH